MKNRKVAVIFSDREYEADEVQFPPIGTQGTTISGLDKWGDYDVIFDNYPCPTPPDPSWVTHKSMIVFLDENTDHNQSIQSDTKQLCA